MKNQILKLTGVLAIVAVVAVSLTNKVEAQRVSMDDVDIRTYQDLGDLYEVQWKFITRRDWVYKGADLIKAQ